MRARVVSGKDGLLKQVLGNSARGVPLLIYTLARMESYRRARVRYMVVTRQVGSAWKAE